MHYTHFKQFLIASICFFATALWSQGAIQESLAFPADKMTLTTDTIDGVIYCNVSYYDTNNYGEPAYPSLPVKYYTFSIPWNATNITVNADVLDTNLTTTPAVVCPMQEPQPADGTEAATFTLPDSSIYATNAYYPYQVAKVVNDGYYQGSNHVVRIAVYPIQYNPFSGILKVNNEINLNVSYSLVDEAALPMRVLSRNNSGLRTEGINNTKSIVYNPSSVEDFAAPLATQIMPSMTYLPGYEYVIITSEELAPAFERLVAFIKAKGYNAGIVTMEDIINSDMFPNGDVCSRISDDAGKLREYLTYAFHMKGTKYVLLGGKEPHVPIRYGYSTIDEYRNSMTYYVPTDLYFSELNSNWNKNNNSIYGESSDSLEYFSDLYVGRLLCTTSTEVNNYIDKLIKHDLNPGNGDYSYLKRSLYTFANTMYHTKHSIETIITDIYPEYHNICQNNSFPSGSYVISQINQFRPYFMSFHNHGNPEGVQLTDITPFNNIVYGLNAIDCEKAHHIKEDGNGLDNILNYDWPGIMYSMSCSTMPFDKYAYNDNIAGLSINFGESYTLGKNYGGVAYIGNTRSGFISSSTLLEKGFLKELKSGNTIITSAMSSALCNMGMDQYYHHLFLAHNLLGDPTIDVWTDIPVKYTDADIDINRAESSIAISGSCLEDAKIVVIDTDGSILNGLGKSVGSTSFTSSPNSHVIIYRHNMIPYIPTLCLQNETITYSQGIFAKDVKIGSSVDVNRTYGNIVFSNSVDYKIYAMGDVEINHGFVVQNTGKVTIYTPGIVKITGGEVQDGGSLTIKATDVLVDGDFIVSNGANVIFERFTQ